MKMHIAVFLALVFCLCVLTGCLVMSGSSVEEKGVRISPATLSQIETGQTTEAWLVATLGEPTSRSSVDERTSILRYAYTREKNTGGAVFLLFAGGSQTKETRTTYFEITDGVVTRHWTEH